MRATTRRAGAAGQGIGGSASGPDPDQEVRLGSRDLGGQEPGAGAAVGEQDHACAEAAQQPRGVGRLAGRGWPEDRVDHGPGPAAGQDQQPQRRVAAPSGGTAALLGADSQVRLAVGNGHDRAVDRDRQQPPPPRPRRGRAAQQEEQLAQRPGPEPPASLGHRGRGRGRGLQPSQPGREPGPDLRVSQLGEQAPAQQQVDHDPGGEATNPVLDPARFLQHRADHLKRHVLRQLTQVTRREPATSCRHGTGNDTLIHGGAPGDKAVFG